MEFLSVKTDAFKLDFSYFVYYIIIQMIISYIYMYLEIQLLSNLCLYLLEICSKEDEKNYINLKCKSLFEEIIFL